MDDHPTTLPTRRQVVIRHREPEPGSPLWPDCTAARRVLFNIRHPSTDGIVARVVELADGGRYAVDVEDAGVRDAIMLFDLRDYRCVGQGGKPGSRFIPRTKAGQRRLKQWEDDPL